jgi:hypothetical protein
MKATIAVTAGLFLATSSIWADEPRRMPAPDIDMGDLAPREIPAKRPWVRIPRNEAGQIVVKFRDSAKVRVQGGGIRSASGEALEAVQQVVDAFGVTFERSIDLPEDVIDSVERRAAFASGRAQPDFNSMLVVNVAPARAQDAANALNRLDEVEFIEWVPKHVNHALPHELRGMTAALANTGYGVLAPPNLTEFQRHKVAFFDVNDNGTIELFGPDDDPLTLDDNEWWGGYDVESTYAVAQILIDEGQTRDWNPNRNGARGFGRKVGVVEDAADVGVVQQAHIDLRHVTLEPGQTLLPAQIVSRDHGTATLGIIAAKDHGLRGPDRFAEGDNAELGMIGMVPDCKPWFFPTVSFENPGGRLSGAILSAFSFFDRGDVLSLSIGFPGQGPLITSQALGLIFQTGSDIGILSVMSAGNDCLELDLADYPVGLADTIVVGAGLPVNPGVDPGLHPGFPYVRLGFSNHYIDPNLDHLDEAPINCQAWGAFVATTGYGDLFATNGRRQLYTAEFGGTSAAAPMVAAACVGSQGISRMFFGIPLTPAQMRGVVAGTYNCQDGICISADETFISGTFPRPEGNPCADDQLRFLDDEGEPLEDPDLIGGFPDYTQIPSGVLTGEWFESSRIVDFRVIRGRQLYGSLPSLTAADGNPMTVRSEFGEAGREGGHRPFPAPTYFFAGDMTDVGVVGVLPNPTAIAQVATSLTVAASGGGSKTVGVEAWNFVTRRYDLLGTGLGVGPAFQTFQTAATRDHVRQSDGTIFVRVWILAQGFGSDDMIGAYDWIDVSPTYGDFGGGAGGGSGGG